MAIYDETSAQDAAKMAGLSCLMMGANGALLLLMSITDPDPDLGVVAILGGFSALMGALAFRIRAGFAAWVPIGFGLFIVCFLINMGVSYIAWQIGDAYIPFSGSLIVIQWLVPLFCLALSASGLRGWWWMRKNGGVMRF
jgi:hypothetical protein